MTNQKHLKVTFLCAAILTLTAQPIGVLASEGLAFGDAKAGKALHDKQCVKCHDTLIYTQKTRSVGSMGGLIGRVEACNNSLNLNLNKDQRNDLVHYLNEDFYKFKE